MKVSSVPKVRIVSHVAKAKPAYEHNARAFDLIEGVKAEDSAIQSQGRPGLYASRDESQIEAAVVECRSVAISTARRH